MRWDIHLKKNYMKNSLNIAALYKNLILSQIIKDKHNFDVHMGDNNGLTTLPFSARNVKYALAV